MLSRARSRVPNGEPAAAADWQSRLCAVRNDPVTHSDPLRRRATETCLLMGGSEIYLLHMGLLNFKMDYTVATTRLRLTFDCYSTVTSDGELKSNSVINTFMSRGANDQTRLMETPERLLLTVYKGLKSNPSFNA